MHQSAVERKRKIFAAPLGVTLVGDCGTIFVPGISGAKMESSDYELLVTPNVLQKSCGIIWFDLR